MLFTIGVDLGETQDYTAICVIEQPLWAGTPIDDLLDDENIVVPKAYERGWVPPSVMRAESADALLRLNAKFRTGMFAFDAPAYLGHIKRFPLPTNNVDVIEYIEKMLRRYPMRTMMHHTRLLADRTGVGQGAVQHFRDRGIYPIAVNIHGGEKVTEWMHDGNLYFRVPKRDLVSSVQVAMQNRLLQVSPELSHADTLRKELQNFRFKIDPKTAHDSYEHWREGDHDDLVLASAMALWWRDIARRELLHELAPVL